MSGPARLEASRIRELLRDEPFVRQLIVRDCVTSTNDVARELAAAGAPEGTVVIADRQTAGRGRLGRPWYSPTGLGLYMSVLFRPSAPIQEWTRWTLAAAVAACGACRQVGGGAAGIEWPNDIVAADRKLGGVLTEMRTGGSRAPELVVGTGLNVLQDESDFPEDLGPKATSLRLVSGQANPARETLAAFYLRELAAVAGQLARGEWSAVSRRWEEMAPGARGCRVRVTGNTGSADFEGVTAGLDSTGALLVRRPDGVEEPVRMAESVVRLDGRVACC